MISEVYELLLGVDVCVVVFVVGVVIGVEVVDVDFVFYVGVGVLVGVVLGVVG